MAIILLAITACVICCCLNATKIKVVLYVKFRLSFWQRLETADRLYDVFVVYDADSQNDDRFVTDEIIPFLEEHRLSVISEDHFPPGLNRFTCLQEAINRSRSALVILTPSLLTANWSMFQVRRYLCTNNGGATSRDNSPR